MRNGRHVAASGRLRGSKDTGEEARWPSDRCDPESTILPLGLSGLAPVSRGSLGKRKPDYIARATPSLPLCLSFYSFLARVSRQCESAHCKLV